MLFLGKVIKSLAIGTIFGVAIGIMVLPELDRKTQRNIRKTVMLFYNSFFNYFNYNWI